MPAFLSELVANRALTFAAAAVAFLVALLLILLVFRLAFGRRLRMPGGRTRQPRLGIVDAFDLDGQRQLVLVRRDNVEHLIMIGKHTDILIESEIVRADVRELREPRGRDKDVKEAQLPPMTPPKPAPSDQRMPPLPAAAESTAIEEDRPQGPARIPPVMPVPVAPVRAPVFPPRRTSMPPATMPKLQPTREPAGESERKGEARQAPVPGAAPAAATSTPRAPSLTPPAFLRGQPRAPQGEPGAIGPQPQGPAQAPGPFAPAPQPAAPRPYTPPSPQNVPFGPPAPPPSEPPSGPPVPPQDMLESLEEEMAKLLGRDTTKP